MLLKRNYPEELVQTGISRAKTLNQLELRTVQPKQTTDNPVTLVTTFNPNNPSIKPLIQIGLTMLKNSPRLKLALQGNTYKYLQDPNLPTKTRESYQSAGIKDA